MHILEMITPSRIGGAETYFAATINRLRAGGDEVTAFCPAGRPIVGYLQQHGITPVTWKTWGKVDPKTLLKLVSLIKSRRIDVVHAHLSSATFIGALAAKIAGIPCVATIHGFVEAIWYRFPHRLIAVSDAVKQHMVAQGIPAEKLWVVYNGLQLDQYQPVSTIEAKKAQRFDPAVLRTGVFGRLAAVKGHDIAIQAWPQVVQHFPTARLMLVGGGKQRDELLQLADQLGIADHVDFTGFSVDPRPLMNACDAVIVPSRKEGLGLAALEAMALQRPVVAAETGGLREVLTDGVTGLFFPPEDHSALADRLLQVLGDAASARQLGVLAGAYVHQHFDINRQIVRLRGVLANTEPQRHEMPSKVTR